MPQIDIALKSTADVGGFTKTAAASQELQRILGRFGNNVFVPLVSGVEQADRRISSRLSSWDRAFSSIAKKFSGGEIAKQFLGAIGIGGGMAIAERAAAAIASHWEDAARSAESVASSSERQLAASMAGIKARQTDEQRVKFLEAARERLQRESDTLRTPQFRERTYLGKWGEEYTVKKRIDQTDAQRERLQAIATELQEVGNEIDELNRKLKAAAQKETAERLKSVADTADQRAENDRRVEENLQRLNDRLSSAAAKYREIAAPAEKYREQLEEIDRLANTFNAAGVPFLNSADAQAARARVLAEMNDTAGKAIRAARAEVERYDIALAELSANPMLTDSEKDARRVQSLNEQNAAIRRLRAELEQLARDNPGLAALIGGEVRSLAELEARNATQAQPRAARIDQARTSYRASQQEGFQTIGEGVQGGFLGYMAQLGTMADQVAAGIQSTLGAAVNSISQGIYGWITGTMSFRQVLLNLGQTVLQTLLQSIIQIGVRMLLNAALSRMLTAAAAAAAIATAAPTAIALSAIWAGPATLASIATLGGAAAQAPASVLAAKATILTSSLAGFADGVANIKGPGTSTSDSILARLSVGESVLTARTTDFLGEDFINQLNADPVGAIARPYRAGASAGAAASGGGEGRRPMTAVFFDRDEMRRYLSRHPDFDVDVVDVMKRNRGEFLNG